MLTDDLKNIKSTEKDLRNFGITVGFVLVALSLLFLWRGKEFWSMFAWVGGMLIVLGVIAPRILREPQRLWMALAILLGWMATRIILTIFFYTCVTPLALLLRFFGKRFLEHGFVRDVESYWHPRTTRVAVRADFEKQF